MINIRSIAAATLAAAIITPSTAVAASAPAPVKVWKPCKTEDSVGCVWDARHQGNGQGKSFLVTRRGKVIYLPHTAVHQMLKGRPTRGVSQVGSVEVPSDWPGYDWEPPTNW